MSGKPTVVSTFAGCGGSSLGYKWAGFHELLAIDFEPHAVETFKLNFPGVDVWQADIRKVSAESILERCGIREGVLDVLDGSPPCQGFSTAGKRKVNDTRNDLALEFVRLIEGLQPRAFVMENVSGMAKGGMRGRFNEILAGLKATGYRVEVRKLNAMYYGVPQSRERIIFIGMRDGQEIEWPAHSNEKPITVREALQGCKDIDAPPLPGWLVEAAHLMEAGNYSGTNAEKAFIKVRGKRTGSMNTKLLSWNRESCTLMKSEIAATGIIHPSKKRYLSIGEMKRLTSFTDEFILEGNRSQQIARLGNAVPPKMMQAIAECVRVVLDG